MENLCWTKDFGFRVTSITCLCPDDIAMLTSSRIKADNWSQGSNKSGYVIWGSVSSDIKQRFPIMSSRSTLDMWCYFNSAF